MDAQRYRLLRELFEAALALPPDRRPEFVAERAGRDPDLEAELLGMLEADARTGFLTSRPTNVGVYRLLQPIGSGGMGAVWMAMRDDDVFRKIVALKIISASAIQGDFLARFRQERQILANLDHPNIARILDGGDTEDGRPFYVMEYVDGLSIVEYCNRAHADISGRLSIFLQACDAVEYIHSLGIIHRDLKPGNILVNGQSRVKVIDFGIAKLVNQVPASPPTMVMTPDYASPEQRLGRQATGSSDVFSLGVILYELLTEKHPFAFGNGVPPPSRNLTATSGRRISGNLDRVALTALETDPSRRYASVQDLAEDLRRVLEGRPISVRNGSRIRQTTRLGWLAASIIVLAVLVAGILVWLTRHRGIPEVTVVPPQLVSSQMEQPAKPPPPVPEVQTPAASASRESTGRPLLQDNFALDSSLNMALWSENTPLLRTVAGKASSPSSQWIAPVIRFHGFGMTMSGPANAYQFTGVQSRLSFSPPFTVQAKVMGLISNGEVFEVYLTRADLERHIAVAGNLGTNSGYRGVWVGSIMERFWDLGPGIFATPAINVWYLITIKVDAHGNASAALADDSGATVGSRDVSGVGSGPFHLILAQREGLPYVIGPNVAVWGQVQVLRGAEAW